MNKDKKKIEKKNNSKNKNIEMSSNERVKYNMGLIFDHYSKIGTEK